MTFEQVVSLVGIAAANFPTLQEKNLSATAELWHRVLADIPYPVCEAALVNVLSTAKFFPTVAEIREAAVELANLNTPTAAEAWVEVIKAVRRYGYYETEKGLASLQPQSRKAVQFIGWREICHSQNVDVIRAQFVKAYERLVAKEKKMALVPNRADTGAQKLMFVQAQQSKQLGESANG